MNWPKELDQKVAEAIVVRAVATCSDRTFGIVNQFVSVHQLEPAGAIPEPVALQLDAELQRAYVYFQPANQSYYLVVELTLEENPQVTMAYIEAAIDICIFLKSSSVTCQEMSDWLRLTPTKTYRPGEPYSNLKSALLASNHEWTLDIPHEVGLFEERVNNVLSILENHRLDELTEVYGTLLVTYSGYREFLGLIELSQKTLERLVSLRLEVSVSLKADGPKWPSVLNDD